MLRSLYSGVSGSRAHQYRMDVIGNNIANVNTTAFKSGRASFQEVLSTALRTGSSNIGSSRGSINPMQIGLGTMLSSVDNDFTPGNLSSTGSVTDLAIQGNGFFVLRDGQKTLFTRDGHFVIGSDGSLTVASIGAKLQGWLAIDSNGDKIKDTIDKSPDLKDLYIGIGKDTIVKPTWNVRMQGNLNVNAETTESWNSRIVVYDSLGKAHTFNVRFNKVADDPAATPPIENQWEYDVLDSDGNSVLPAPTAPATAHTMSFDKDGLPIASSITANTFSFSPPGAGSSTLPPPIGTQEVNLDFSGLTQRSLDFSAKMKDQDGFPVGVLERISINASGEIIGHYGNQMSMTLAQVALAGFDNAAGLYKTGNSSYESTPAAGFSGYGSPDLDGRGSIASMHLEMSNVDLSEELTDMIVTQRGLQANTKVITTSDEILQDLMSIKR